jgi:hypothetical protein
VVAAMVAAQLKEIPMAKADPTSRANNSKTKAHNGERQTTARNAAPLKSATVAAHRRPRLSAQPTARRESKKAHLIAMLRAPSGATIEAMALAANWQPHSVRGFLAGRRADNMSALAWVHPKRPEFSCMVQNVHSLALMSQGIISA